MKCPKCGNEISDNYCTNCGFKRNGIDYKSYFFYILFGYFTLFLFYLMSSSAKQDQGFAIGALITFPFFVLSGIIMMHFLFLTVYEFIKNKTNNLNKIIVGIIVFLILLLLRYLLVR